jgi:ribonuclease G
MLSKQNEKDISIVLHPYLYAYFVQGFPSRRMKWFIKYKRWVKIIKDTSLGITEFHFRNQMGEDIEIIPAEVI